MIRPMQKQDVPRVAEIHVNGWRHTYRGIVSDEYLFGKMLVAKRIPKFEEAMANPETVHHDMSYVFDDGIVKAFLTVGRCRDDDMPEAFELGGIYVDCFFQGQGIGSKLVAHCEKISGELGFGQICLWVFEKNETARKFYEKHGYTVDGKRQTIESLENAVGIRYCKKIS